jgi:hypothetical protein
MPTRIAGRFVVGVAGEETASFVKPPGFDRQGKVASPNLTLRCQVTPNQALSRDNAETTHQTGENVKPPSEGNAIMPLKMTRRCAPIVNTHYCPFRSSIDRNNTQKVTAAVLLYNSCPMAPPFSLTSRVLSILSGKLSRSVPAKWAWLHRLKRYPNAHVLFGRQKAQQALT